MRILRCFCAFLFVFTLLALAMICPTVSNIKSETVNKVEQKELETQAVQAVVAYSKQQEKTVKTSEEKEEKEDYIPRLQAPSEQNEYYYSDENAFYRDGWGMPNCTAYAYGRAYELTEEKPQLSLGDACEWYDFNKEYEAYEYGKKPKLGAVACWGYKDGGSGHVAVVEKIEDDIVYCSNSAWGGAQFYVDSFPVDNPENASDNLIFHGYIYVCDN